MIRKVILTTVFMTIFMTPVISSEKQPISETESMGPKIIHVPVSYLRENEKLVVEARVDGSSERVIYMRLYFKSKGEQSYDYIEMVQSALEYFGELPPSRFSPPELEYFILALLTDQSVVTYPEWNPYGNPVVVSIAGGPAPTQGPGIEKPPESEPSVESILGEESSGKTGDTELGVESPLLILSPENGEEFEFGEEVVIAVSFFSLEEAIDLQSINVFIDGLNVTRATEINENLLTYTTSNLKPGKHQVFIQGYYASGVQLPSVKWSFTVLGKQKRASISSLVSGRVYAESRQENISDIGFSDNNIGGSITGKYGVANFDARVYLTTRENSRFQPRHRYTIRVDLPIIGATFGDTYPRFNDLMLWGKRVRGIYGRVHFGFFNIDVVHGETKRRIAAEYQPNIAGLDSLVRFGTFRQRILGLRPSFGSGKHFQLGFTLLKVRDDLSSLAAGESIQSPRDNLAVGSDLLIAIDNRRIELRASAAVSLITNDITNGPLSKQEVEDQFDVKLPFDPADFKDYLIINSSTTPLDPRELTSLAWNVNFRLNYFNNRFQFGYKSIGSEYFSLGNTFLRNDIRGFYIRDRFRLYQNRIFLNLGYELYDDNFSQDNNNPITKLRTFNYGISIFPGPGLPNLNFNMRNYNRDNDVNQLDIDLTSPSGPDTTDNRENNNTRDISVQLNYDVNILQLNHTITLGYIASDRDDRFGRNLTNLSSNVQTFSIRTQYQIPLVTTFTFARNDNKFAAGLNTFNFNMFGGRAEYLFFNKKLKTYSGVNYVSASGLNINAVVNDSTITDYNRLAFSAGVRFEITPGHSIRIDGQIIRFLDHGKTVVTIPGGRLVKENPSFTDRMFRLFYEKRF
jgi:hypothetical protein